MAVLLIHGPLCLEMLKKTINQANRCLFDFEIVVSTYYEAEPKIEAFFSSMEKRKPIRIAYSNDVMNPGFYNLNRQINLVNAGLSLCRDEEIVIKLRMDQTVTLNKVFGLIGTYKKDISSGKLMTTNCFTRKDRLYHPSDMFIVGIGSALRKYYPRGLDAKTHLDCQLLISFLYRRGQNDFSDFWPESYLFKNFLKQVKWEFRNNTSDSMDSMRRYCIIVNSWEIDLKWIKFLGGKVPVLPYEFTMSPFIDGPVETASCIKTWELGRRYRFKDHAYLCISKLYYRGNLFRFKGASKEILRRRGAQYYRKLLNYCPPVLHILFEKLARKIYISLKT